MSNNRNKNHSVRKPALKNCYQDTVGDKNYRLARFSSNLVSGVAAFIIGILLATQINYALIRLVKTVAITVARDKSTGKLVTEYNQAVFDVGVWSTQGALVAVYGGVIGLLATYYAFKFMRDLVMFAIRSYEHKMLNHQAQKPRQSAAKKNRRSFGTKTKQDLDRAKRGTP